MSSSEKDFEVWIQKEYLTKKKIQELQKQFQNNSPFQHLELENFFREDKISRILKTIQKEIFLNKESDLFKFMQTQDLSTSQEKEIQEFHDFMTSEIFTNYIKNITGITIQKGDIDLSASLYQNTDYLLPHDDQLENRKIAFILYLTSLQEKDGGKLIFYKTKNKTPLKEEKVIIPERNTLILFKVSEKSFHEVEEVISNVQRISIGGWFHGAHHKSTLSQNRKY